jgi:hypothetical protein
MKWYRLGIRSLAGSGALTFVVLLFLVPAPPVIAQGIMPTVLPEKERAAVIDRWLEERFETVIPELMNREEVDVWVVVSREYNEDPVIETMLPATWMAARRRTILIFRRRPDGSFDRAAVARYNVGESFPSSWVPEEQPDQWKRAAEIITEFSPRTIAVNSSATFGLADGITHTEYNALVTALPEESKDRVISGENLAIGWLETRTPSEMAVYPLIVRIAHQIIAEGFSEAVIQPGVTSTEDVEWWYRDRIRSLGLDTWFHPSVDVQRHDNPERDGEFSSREAAAVIRPGDLINVDFGIKYLRLNTDTQQHAYVLRPGETEAPAGLAAAFAVGNRLQDILTNEFRTGRTGNQILASALDNAKTERIAGTIYTHPIGFHGHAAGPTIGLWDQQEGVPGAGDYPLYPNTAYSIELNAAVPVPEWSGKKIRIMLEEDAFFDGQKVWYIGGRQTELMLIPRQ